MPSRAAIRRVLLVEDEFLVAMLTDDLVEAAGFQVEHANDGAAALALIERLPHLDAAVVNLNLGLGPNGKQVVRALRARWAGLPILVVTGYMAGTPEADLRGLGGPTVRLHKPVDTEEPSSLLASLGVNGWRAHDASQRTRRRGKSNASASQ
jgi:DNA-binding response OmpR family regulator